ncbi:outer membrane cobalamin receptor [Pedobacter sp. CAN_A7]|uniref:TonB-dependent receptor n=1 Tax=Pedobacter sp. CAN_A7 TaxID=2787722 RepID=UPI0018CA28A3
MAFIYYPLKFKLSKTAVSSLLFTLFMLFTFLSHAQDLNGTVSGKITDQENNILENATVSLRGTSTNVMTNAAGEFSISASAGNYELWISLVGHQRKSMKVTLVQGKTLSLGTIALVNNDNDLKELHVEGKTQVKTQKEQAFNVNVIDAKQLYNTSADLNLALNKTSGVRIREDGGVGSNFSFSLNGFSGKQVKFFLDGIPMDNFGSSLALNNFPVNMAERVEVYKGVLPISLGADALGGAINVVTRSNPNFTDFSYGYGSFNTHKASLNHAYTHAKTGFTVHTNAFYNFSDNNYKVNISPIALTGPQAGQKGPEQEVNRFHDGYESATVQLELGVTGKKYADKLLFGVIASGNERDIQTGVTMDQVFGGRTAESSSVIPTLKYKKANLFIEGLDLSLYTAYNMGQNKFIDTTRLKYNWLQETIPTSAAELTRSQLKNKDKEGLFTANLAYQLQENHALSFNYVMTDFRRKSSDVEDPQNVTFLYPQQLNKQVMGLAWQATYDNFTATAFSKLYLLDVSSFERVSNGTTVATYQALSTNTSKMGYGVAGAYFILPKLQAKASYEHTYRMPEAVELLGDGLYTRRNSALKPESSNNINLGALYSFNLQNDHQFGVEASYIFRNAEDYIRLDQAQAQPIDRQYINIGDVRTNGVEGEIRYAWKNKIHASINLTYQNILDKEKFLTSTNLTGTTVSPNLGYGYRIPNMPYLFGNADLGYTFNEVGAGKNALSLNYSLNYVEKYYLTPNHLGQNNQDDIPRQIAHNIMANYAVQQGKYNISLECRNLADNDLFDSYRLQKPGRSVFLKLRYFINK